MNGQQRITCYIPGIALCGVAFNLFALVAAPLSKPDLDLMQQALSYYAIGPWGMLQTAAFTAMGIASIALSLALVFDGARSLWMRLAIVLLCVGGIASFGLVLYPMGEPGPATILGDAHQTAGSIGGVAQLAAAFAFILAIRADPRWRHAVGPALFAFALSLLGAMLTQAAIWWPERGIPMGAVMRLAFVPLVVLWGLVALRLSQRCPRPVSRPFAAR